ncbi:hypothetical protein TNCV_2187801 [Trichonephila clavipes]|nr:hypothetical protein TNCV_2187801 [Trichonephila clavipes]
MSDGRKSTTANIDHKDSSSSSSLSRANKTLDTFYSPVLRVSNSSALGIAQSQKVTMPPVSASHFKTTSLDTLLLCHTPQVLL